jgi:molybdopterin-guanine dinucleotide biosynthesis protein MobB
MPEAVGPAASPRIVSLLGHSGSGKTALATEIVGHWSAQGLRVGYVKHASHGFEMDRPGKDTHRVAAAGAAGVVVTGPNGVAYVESRPEADPRVLVRRFFPDADAVVVEGFRSAAIPAVLVVGEDDPATAVAAVPGPLLAVVGRGAEAAARGRGVPAFEPADRPALLAHLAARLGFASRTA